MQRSLSENTGDFWVSKRIKILEKPSTIEFMREAVCSYEPVIIRGLIDHWPAVHNWNLEELCRRLRAVSPHQNDRLLKVNVTPDGHGDCIKRVISPGCETASPEPHFVYPAECFMSTSVFADMMLNRQEGDAVPYLSLQNDNLRQEMPELMSDIESSIPIATEAFGFDAPEAINLWIGDERSVSSMHKDHFENMYAVIAGEKTFTLLPPTDVAFLQEVEHPTLRYTFKSESDIVQAPVPVPQPSGDRAPASAPARTTAQEASAALARADNQDIPSPVIDRRVSASDMMLTPDGVPVERLSWITTDPEVDPEDITYDPSKPSTHYALAHPLRVKVQAGEVLYIPAMWYHRVSQTQLTIAVNYWYDQRFDFRYSN
jgi:jumonji domain-containing protein 7